MAPTDTTWTEDSVTRLRELRDEGHPTAEIGRRLGTTKNAVVGEAHRLALPSRPSPIRWGPGSAPAMARPAHPSAAPPPDSPRRGPRPRGRCPVRPYHTGQPSRTGAAGRWAGRAVPGSASARPPPTRASYTYRGEHRAPAYVKTSRPRADRHAP